MTVISTAWRNFMQYNRYNPFLPPLKNPFSTCYYNFYKLELTFLCQNIYNVSLASLKCYMTFEKLSKKPRAPYDYIRKQLVLLLCNNTLLTFLGNIIK